MKSKAKGLIYDKLMETSLCLLAVDVLLIIFIPSSTFKYYNLTVNIILILFTLTLIMLILLPSEWNKAWKKCYSNSENNNIDNIVDRHY